jgi:DNA-binding NtrC family response regulator
MTSAAPPRPARILVIEDDAVIRSNVAELLSEEGFEVSTADNGEAGIALANARNPELIICDIMLPLKDGYAVLKTVREAPRTAHIPFIFLTAKAERADMRLGMNLGADDYLTKPFSLAELLEAVQTRLRRTEELAKRARAAIEGVHERTEVPPVPGLSAADGVIVLDPAMRVLYEQAARVAVTHINLLILGETGVGKEVLARAVHALSARSKGPFVAINCGALTESLLEAELFGNEKGAFTGALSARVGLLETASSGTLFLDEVGELTLAIQAKLLRVLEERKLLRVGGRAERDVDVRFLAATNRNLEEEVARGRFREDLYYRLNGISLTIPPLSARRSEIAALCRVFLARFCAELGRAETLTLSPECLAILENYAWPGNLRELKNVIQRGIVLCQGNSLLPEHLPTKLVNGGTSSRSSQPAVELGASQGAPGEPHADRREALQRELNDLERKRIQAALEETGGNQSLAAEKLGISRRTLVYRLTALGLPRPRKRV